MKLVSRHLALCLLTMLLFNSCKKKSSKEPEKETPVAPVAPSPLPVVSTDVIGNLSFDSATGGGNVTSEGTSALTAVGICWDTQHNPTTLRPHTNEGAGTGTFQSNITNLLPNTTYYVRAYATNASGTAYGQELSFKTLYAWQYTGIFNPTFNNLICYDDKIFGYGYSTILRVSSNEGATWSQSFGGSGSIMGVAATGSAIFLIPASAGNPVYISTNKGVSWTTTSATPTTTNPGLNYTGLVAGTTALYAPTLDNGIFMSPDNGATWNLINNNLPDMFVQRLAVNNSALLAITGIGADGLFFSANNGANWTSVSNGLSGKIFDNVAICDGNFFLGTSDGNFMSTDNGTTWTNIDSKLNNPNFSIQFVTEGANVLAFGANSNLTVNTMYLSKDKGLNWMPLRNGLANLRVEAAALNGSKAYCQTYNGNFYKLDLP